MTGWQKDAACKGKDTDRWFALESDPATYEAKQVCAGCPVRESCLQFAIDNPEHFGVWGGLTGRERAKLRNRRNRRAGSVGPVCGEPGCGRTVHTGGLCRGHARMEATA